jgi:hypothetical protein
MAWLAAGFQSVSPNGYKKIHRLGNKKTRIHTAPIFSNATKARSFSLAFSLSSQSTPARFPTPAIMFSIKRRD